MAARSPFQRREPGMLTATIALGRCVPQCGIFGGSITEIAIGAAAERLLPSGRQTTSSLACQVSSCRTRFDWNSEELLRQFPIV
jgi:hypothetical protein